MVSFCCEIFLLCAAALMLTFFIAGLLFICASSTSITWERTPHPVRRPAFSSHLLSPAIRGTQQRFGVECSRELVALEDSRSCVCLPNAGNACAHSEPQYA